MRQLLRQSKSGKLSGLYRSVYKNVVDVCVAQARQEEFYHALDAMNCYQMTAGWYRRSLRSDSYLPFVEDSIRLLRAYALLEFYGGDLAAVLAGQISQELYDHARYELGYSWILAAQIDRGEEPVIRVVREILFGENNTLMIAVNWFLALSCRKVRSFIRILENFCSRRGYRRGHARSSARRWMQADQRHSSICFR